MEEHKAYRWLIGAVLAGVALLTLTSSLRPLAQMPPSRLAAQVIQTPRGTSQISISREDAAAAHKKFDDLEKFLADLERRLNALPAAPSTPPPISGVDLASVDGQHSFGRVAFFESVDKTFQVRHALMRPVTFVELQGLSGSIGFKGGRYPGTGGTCAERVSSECTIVLSFSPRLTDAVERLGENYYKKTLKLIVADGAVHGESNTLVVGGRAELTAHADLEMVLVAPPKSVFPGESSPLVVRVDISAAARAAGKSVHMRDVRVSSVEPFHFDSDSCQDSYLKLKGGCELYLSFRPKESGNVKKTLKASVDVGLSERKELTLEVSGTGLASSVTVDNLLVVYNTGWGESVEAKNYYLTNRPGIREANTLGVNFPLPKECSSIVCLANSLQLAPSTELKDRLIVPIIAWMKSHPEKNITYVLLMRGFPTRPDTGPPGKFTPSLQSLIREEASRSLSREVWVTTLDMGSLEATKAYVDKLKDMHSRMPRSALLLSAQSTDKAGTTYYISAVKANEGNLAADTLRAASPQARIVFTASDQQSLRIASDVTGYFGGGNYEYEKEKWKKIKDNIPGVSEPFFGNPPDPGREVPLNCQPEWKVSLLLPWIIPHPNNCVTGEYMLDGSITFTGKSGWYIIETGESFNGLWLTDSSQGNFIKWFSRKAFGSSNYEYTPVAAVTRISESSSTGGNVPELFPCWDSGQPFAYCAWKSSQASTLQAIGDPWVTR